MEENKNPNGEIVIEGKTLRWLDNFWYHYKWIAIGVLAALVIVFVCVFQTCSAEKKDIIVVYAGPTYLSVSESEQLAQVMNTVMPYDFDENGEKHVVMNLYEIYSEEQMQAINAEASEGGKYVDGAHNTSQYQNYTTYMQTGESCVYLLDPWLYQSLGKEYLCPLSEVTEEVPKGAIDEYAVRLGDTDLYAEYGVLRLLPEDTVICMMINVYTLFGKPAMDEEEYQCEKDMLRALVTYVGKETAAE
ncbi:MAG: hypothetical protein E7668_06005 [Ruminococcaceae bacterium]|nr:hypothetical protein [Oscillospiraceae bacterium]